MDREPDGGLSPASIRPSAGGTLCARSSDILLWSALREAARKGLSFDVISQTGALVRRCAPAAVDAPHLQRAAHHRAVHVPFHRAEGTDGGNLVARGELLERRKGLGTGVLYHGRTAGELSQARCDTRASGRHVLRRCERVRDPVERVVRWTHAGDLRRAPRITRGVIDLERVVDL